MRPLQGIEFAGNLAAWDPLTDAAVAVQQVISQSFIEMKRVACDLRANIAASDVTWYSRISTNGELSTDRMIGRTGRIYRPLRRFCVDAWVN